LGIIRQILASVCSRAVSERKSSTNPAEIDRRSRSYATRGLVNNFDIGFHLIEKYYIQPTKNIPF